MDPLCLEQGSKWIATVFALKIRHPLCTKKLSFEAIRARMKKTIGGDEHLDFSGQNIGAKEDH